MSGLADKVLDLIGVGTPAPIPATFREQADALRAALGVRGAARVAGVDRRTYQRWYERWAQGKEPRPRPGTVPKLGRGLRSIQVARSLPTSAEVSLQVRDSHAGRQGGRTRVITGAQLKLREGSVARAADEWVRTGDPEAAAAVFLSGVGDSFYRRWLAPPAAQRAAEGATTPAPSSEGGGPRGGGGDDGDDGDDDDDDGDDDDDFDDMDSYDEFYDAQYDAEDIPDDYFGEVTG